MPVTCRKFHKDFLDNPVDFLRHYFITIAGGAAGGVSGVNTFQFWDRVETVKGFTTGFSGKRSKQKDRPKISLTKQGVFNNMPSIENNYFNAHYVSMWKDKFAGLLARQADCTYNIPTQATVSKSANPDIMLTSQLTGCTFGIGEVADNEQLLMHIQPGAGQGLNPENCRLHLQQTVTALLGENNVYGIFERENQDNSGYKNDENGATVVGVRKNDQWKFFSQVWQRGGKGPLLSVVEIKQ